MTKKLARWVAGLCIGLCCHRPAKDPHTITIPLKYRAEILDPLHAVDESTVMVVNFLHRRLYEYTPDGKLEPVLVAAEKREGRRVWLHLKPGPVSPEDVVYALERVQKDANQSWVLEQIRRVRKHGPDSVELELAASARPAETEWQLARIKLSLPQCAIFRAAEHKTHKQFIPFSRYRLAEQMGDRILLAASDGSPSLE
ncbi:MAG: hypothetical protein NZL89_01705, partial [Leptospiraceae bacterium]|nr:hypothetical protein [Leptospiraceae bacterium]